MPERDDGAVVGGNDGAKSWRVIKVVDFATERVEDLERAESWARRRNRRRNTNTHTKPTTGSDPQSVDVNGAWEPQRKAMRRRTTGHRSYRMPVRLRLGKNNKMQRKTHGVKRVKLSAHVRELPTPRGVRLLRRRPHDLMLRNCRVVSSLRKSAKDINIEKKFPTKARSQLNTISSSSSSSSSSLGTWLQSHRWMVKRMRMDVRWGGQWTVPVTSRIWGQRHVVSRLKTDAVFQDCSFLSCFQIEAGSAEVLANALTQAFGLPSGALVSGIRSSGGRTVDVMLSRVAPADQESNTKQNKQQEQHGKAQAGTSIRPICPAQVIWCPTHSKDSSDTDPGHASLWLWVHPLAHQEVTNVLESIDTHLTFTDVSNELIMFRIRGPRSHAAVASLLVDNLEFEKEPFGSSYVHGVNPYNSATSLLKRTAKEAHDVAVFPHGVLLSGDLRFECGAASSTLAQRVPSLLRNAVGASNDDDDDDDTMSIDDDMRVECPVTGRMISAEEFVSYFSNLRPSEGQRRLDGRNPTDYKEDSSSDTLLSQLQELSRVSLTCHAHENPFTSDLLWKQQVRTKAQRECESKLPQSCRVHVPALVAFHARRQLEDRTQVTNGCDLIVPCGNGIGQHLATRLSIAGALPVGVADMELASALDARPCFPRDYPDSVCTDVLDGPSSTTPSYGNESMIGLEVQSQVQPRAKISGKSRSKFWREQNTLLNAKGLLGGSVSVWRGSHDTWRALIPRCPVQSWQLPESLCRSGLLVMVVVRMHRCQPDGVSSRLVPGSYIVTFPGFGVSGGSSTNKMKKNNNNNNNNNMGFDFGAGESIGVVTSTSSMACTSASEEAAVGIGFCTLASFVALTQAQANGANAVAQSGVRSRRRARQNRAIAVEAPCLVFKHTTDVCAHATITLFDNAS